MPQLSANVRVKIIFFVGLAFSVYYSLYFQSFNQGVVEGGSSAINIIKLFSIFFLISAFFSRDISFTFFDINYLFLIFGFTSSYFIAGLFFGFNDSLFLNFLIFSFCYPFLVSDGAELKIYYTYEIICIVIFIQAIGDIIISLFGKMLWDGGLYIGGLGNPTSFSFISLFCLAYITLGKNNFSNCIRAFFSIIYIFSVLMAKALFPILMMPLILLIAIIRIQSKKWKAFFAFAPALAATIFLLLADFEGGLLENKFNSLLYYFGLSDVHTESLSVSTRLENVTKAVEFVSDIDIRWILGHYQDLTYYPVDSQYISIILSFGLFLFIYFIIFNFTALMKFSNNKYNNNGIFIFYGLILCNFMFINNRILDYFPLGFIYISLISLISRPTAHN